jgi:hypothetical protein
MYGTSTTTARMGASQLLEVWRWVYTKDEMTSPDRTYCEVAIHGAGFSRAISDHLPLANKLGQLAYERARCQESSLFDPCLAFSNDYPFETWLSLLVEEQPHLDEGDNRLNAARIAKLAQSIVEVLNERQALALSVPGPPWLYKILSAFHQRKTTVVTFNYDTLSDVAINSTYLGLPAGLSWTQGDLRQIPMDMGCGPPVPKPAQVLPEDVMGSEPPLITIPHPPKPTMRLLKLHGSLGWWWVPNDASGATLAREPILSPFGDSTELAHEEKRRTLAGREPFIVPPLTMKSPY